LDQALDSEVGPTGGASYDGTVFNINGGEVLILLLLALMLVGPAQLPKYAQQVRHLARRARDYVREAKGKVEGELGLEEGEIDWKSLDPRQYDPRRIVREALADDKAKGLGLGLRPSPSGWQPAPPRRSTPVSQHRPVPSAAPAGPPIVEQGHQDGGKVENADRQG
jgi:sec-independent protein translocase protein TatB